MHYLGCRYAESWQSRRLLVKLVLTTEPCFLLVALFGVIGHNLPVYYRFRGGRGESPIIGSLLVINWFGLIITNLAAFPAELHHGECAGDALGSIRADDLLALVLFSRLALRPVYDNCKFLFLVFAAQGSYALQ